MSTSKRKKDMIDYIHPIEINPLHELRAAFGYLFGTSYRGIEMASVLKAKRLIKYVMYLAECDVFSDTSKDFVMSNLPRLLEKLHFALYGCIDLGDRQIGLSHLRQVMPSIDNQGNVYMICSGFNQFVPFSDYHDMRQYSYEQAESVIMQVMVVFQVLIDDELSDDDERGSWDDQLGDEGDEEEGQ